GVVIDLDTARHPFQPEGPGESFQQPRLRRRLRKPPSEGLARILHGMGRKILLLTALRNGNGNLAAGPRRQGLGQQILLVHLVRKQDRARRGLVVIELGQKGTEHGGSLQRRIRLGKIGAIAPVLARAEKEDLYADRTAFLVDSENVSLLHCLRVDALVALHMRQGSQTIAKDRRPLEVLLLGRLLHGLRHLRLHLLAAAREKVPRLIYQRRICAMRDLAGARSRAALDLIEQARPSAVLEKGIRAASEQECALKRVDRAPDRLSRGKGAEIV